MGFFFQYYSHDDKHVFAYVKDWIFKQSIVFEIVDLEFLEKKLK